MVVKVTRSRVCDICENDNGVRRYRITKLEDTRQRTVTTDLCADHSSQVEEAIDTAPAPRRGRKGPRPVVSLDEVAAKKKPARKKAPAKAGAPRK
jgi:hypothetical protein